MRLIKIILFILISLNISFKVISDDNLQNLSKGGGKLIFIRHAYAPGSGDPNDFNLLNCKTQRNLNTEGINQSKRIGQYFIKNNIKISKILSSEWCRCKQTAEFAFNNYETKNFLNSFFSEEFSKNKDKQIKEFKGFIKKWNGKENIIFITHYVVILEILNLSVLSGEIIITDKNLNILVRQNTLVK
jgi:phosphohistidine phosphatase SixA